MCQWKLQSILIVVIAFLRDQISLHGDEGYPLNGELRYDLDMNLEILIKKMPEDPHGLDWSELQDVVVGLWKYIVTGMRYRPVTFDILNIEDDTQKGWGHIAERASLSNTTAKRSLQLSSLTLPSSANAISDQRNSSLPMSHHSWINWPVENSDMTLRFTVPRRWAFLDPEATRNLFLVVIEMIQDAIAAKGQEAFLDGHSIQYGELVVLEFFYWPRTLTWEHLATTVLGLIDFIVDDDHYRSWSFLILVQETNVKIASGEIYTARNQGENLTIAKRNSGYGDGAGRG